jgi:ATP-dependent DNA helicase RecQ
MTRAKPSRDSDKVRTVARVVFGHESLHPGQQKAIGHLLGGHDVLLVSPTGSGKSLAYQLPGVLIDGVTVVVSPLLALQHDQVSSLEDGGARTRSARISSAETQTQHEEALAKAGRGELEFLFLAPEQLAKDEVRTAIGALRPSLVAVDEAHCVSAWGHDFRPDYLRLGQFIEDLGRPRIIALTATASQPVREDIVSRLRMRGPQTVVTGFARDNIALGVERCTDADDQRDRVLAAVQERSGLGIVYCRTRRATEEYAAALSGLGIPATHFHAGLAKRRRAEVHDAFLAGEVPVVVATSAFGMGIDKPDLRFVVHAQVPGAPDTYYQEVGRAGRDDQPAEGLLFYRPEDLSLGRFFSAGIPARADVEAVLGGLAEGHGHDRARLKRQTGFGPRKLGRILNLVDEVRAAEPSDGDRLVDAVIAQAESHRSLDRSRVEMMRAYAETARCRTEFLAGYFGEELEHVCGHCDNCLAGTAQQHEDEADAPFPLQSSVQHEEFGRGTIMDVEPDRITVLFEDVGYRTLDAAVVAEHGLLKPLG